MQLIEILEFVSLSEAVHLKFCFCTVHALNDSFFRKLKIFHTFCTKIRKSLKCLEGSLWRHSKTLKSNQQGFNDSGSILIKENLFCSMRIYSDQWGSILINDDLLYSLKIMIHLIKGTYYLIQQCIAAQTLIGNYLLEGFNLTFFVCFIYFIMIT